MRESRREKQSKFHLIDDQSNLRTTSEAICGTMSKRLERRCLEQMYNVLKQWSDADVRVVPNVMVQVRCGDDQDDPINEYRIHWFNDITETYIHNHQYSFDTYCLEGEYIERLWTVNQTYEDVTTYKFPRITGNTFGSVIPIRGSLQYLNTRRHYPGNQMHLDYHQYHSIIPAPECTDGVVTFVVRKKLDVNLSGTFVLSSSPTINAPTDEIVPASSDERQGMRDKLEHLWLANCYAMQIPLDVYFSSRKA